MSKTPKVKCPTCRRQGDWLAAPWGPFCSQRCRLIDLGKWLGEEHAISRPVSAGDWETAADSPAARRTIPPDVEPNEL